MPKFTISESQKRKFCGLGNVKFPVEVEGRLIEEGKISVSGSEIIRVGGDYMSFNSLVDYVFLTSEI